ncbi:TPA: VirB3 family type IV secretion system protein [Pseudomonas putida]|jgi:type IV secretion system protein VirB3|uniref:Type IV secretion system protein VirB3 n=2 Tax=Pseudomonas TaxID=286 RepID=A0A7Y1AC16_PSEVE|nr:MULTISPECIES: VirB3 family type IV secretion system protein [Pseudomonas]ELU0816501.1 VirB3 family type IV secretion system protein [Pseudomonas putida]AJO81881.1 type IV secretory pathway VirB3 family protein [Pseudomonas sp. MRSN 12121]EKJ7650734.1 VirB3 family type IV secretion system protein [Pseudomonas aeruginosa]ELH1095576.1 VirB3 family type IV secretion system protein [Pseudomonas aeruginosa]ELL4401265.1 VirB3 family type IV secretion system protein [Pseudomonas aeruginosa]
MDKNDGILVDTLFVGPTRPTMRWGVTWQAFIINMVFTIECFVLTKNLLWLLAFIPIHLMLYCICLYDPRAFELIYLWGRTKAFAFLGNFYYWRAATYSPLEFNVGKKLSKRKLRKLQKRGLL